MSAAILTVQKRPVCLLFAVSGDQEQSRNTKEHERIHQNSGFNQPFSVSLEDPFITGTSYYL